MRRAAQALAALVLLGGAALWAGDRWIAATELPPLLAETSVEVVDREGRLLSAFTVADGRWRLATGPVDPTYRAMLIAYEDKRFFRHRGIDPLALLRAAGQAARHGRAVSGGSTLTMQLARLLEDSGTGRWAGKLRQMRVALALERRLEKEAILALYLSRVPMGGNLEGLRAGTLAWFGQPPARLTPAQAALLVALPQAPEARRPDRHPQAARAARDRVLTRMAAQGVIDPDTAAAARRAPVPTARRPMPALGPHLAARARADRPDAALHRLTLDGDLQYAMEALARRAVTGRDLALSAAILVADHRSGAILAHVGSPDFTDTARAGFVDMTAAPRSPGSTLKPLVYGLAFDDGRAHPETLIEDRPTTFGTYAPSNFDGRFRGTLRLSEALQLSLNIPAVKLAQAVGPARLMARLRRAGATPVLPAGQPGLAVALGGLGLSLEDLARLYAALANGGRPVALHWRADAPPPAPAQAVLSPRAAWQVADILRGVPAPPAAPQGRIAFKTGTSYGHRDAWAVGFDGAHVAAVWLGRADGTPVPGAFGADRAAPLLFEIFARLGHTPLPPAPADTLILPNAALPAPLRRFETAPHRAGGTPAIAFPPDGAELALTGAPLTVKLRDGRPPFTLLTDGAPQITGLYRHEAQLPAPGPGFVTLTVIDAGGNSARVRLRLY